MNQHQWQSLKKEEKKEFFYPYVVRTLQSSPKPEYMPYDTGASMERAYLMGDLPLNRKLLFIEGTGVWVTDGKDTVNGGFLFTDQVLFEHRKRFFGKNKERNRAENEVYEAALAIVNRYFPKQGMFKSRHPNWE